MGEYVIWAAEEIEHDYPGYSWEVYVDLVTRSSICETIYKYSIDRYLEVRDNG